MSSDVKFKIHKAGPFHKEVIIYVGKDEYSIFDDGEVYYYREGKYAGRLLTKYATQEEAEKDWRNALEC